MSKCIKIAGLTFLILVSFFCIGGLRAFPQNPVKPQVSVPTSFCISPAEFQLYNMVKEYRIKKNLPVIPLSRSLCYVATAHVRDLYFNHPDRDACNFHSWSGKGPWKPFCYPQDENKKNSVWDKPKEFTPYKGKAFEIVYWENTSVNIDSVMAFWTSVAYFNSFLMNVGKWQGTQWNAIGIGICENYACAWFGEIPDQDGTPAICGNAHAGIVRDTSVTPPGKKNVVAINSKEKSEKDFKPDTLTRNAKLSKLERLDVQNGKFYIIVKSQIPLSEARLMIKGIKEKGFPDAKIIQRENKIRISVYESISKLEAEKKLSEVRKIYKDAWLLKN